jgi:hypothetical protein
MGSTRVNSRIDRATDNIPRDWINGLTNDINTLKSQNQVVGPDSVSVQRVTSGATWDINGASISGYALKSYRVVFTPAHMKNPYATFFYSYSISGGTGYELLYYWPDTTNTTATQRAWIFTISNDSNNISLFVQFILKCVDTGSIVVTAL